MDKLKEGTNSFFFNNKMLPPEPLTYYVGIKWEE